MLPVVTHINIIRNRIKRTVFLANLVFSTANSQYSGTTIITCITRDTVVVAADSRVTTIDLVPLPYFVCKIYQVNDSTFFASSGVYSPVLLKTVKEILGRRDSMSVRIEDASEAMGKYFREELRAKPDTIFRIEVIFIWRDGGILNVGYRSARFDKEKMLIRDGENIVPVESPQYIASTPFGKSVLNATTGFRSIPIIPRVLALTNLALKLDTLVSGRPIDVLCLTRNRYEWIKKKPEWDTN